MVFSKTTYPMDPTSPTQALALPGPPIGEIRPNDFFVPKSSRAHLRPRFSSKLIEAWMQLTDALRVVSLVGVLEPEEVVPRLAVGALLRQVLD